MNIPEQVIEELISKYLVGEASEREVSELMDWCALSPENQKYLDDARVIFEKAQLSEDVQVDVDAAWEKVRRKISGNEKKTRFLILPWGIAAGLILVFALAYVFYQNLPAQEFSFVSEKENRTEILPDQTELALKQGSEVQVEYNERKKKGLIQLKGEALISIPDTKKVQWMVEVGELRILDIGTVFHVQGSEEAGTVEVSVQEGEVRFFLSEDQGIDLKAGEKGIYDKQTQKFTKEPANPNVAAFRSRQFFFEESSLAQVVEDLESGFGRKIVLAPNLATCRLTVTFENEDLETILGIIAETLSLEVVYDSDQIRIQGEGCE
ncbi:FecR domain-containing protein [Algoriphagus taiwanensis]|uniref:FecR family protein n=1 Tax=Algoriphagus taiwanensis TaxID=1445656 RepID=A0ABQ6Q741_9BACT|nr:hypothetical protein Ataiwa_37630 [Algoriphagus taiwanensis]